MEQFLLNSRGTNVRSVWEKRRVIPGDNPLEYLKSLADSLVLRFEEFVENGVSQSIRRKTDDVIELLEVVGRYFHRCPVFKIKGIHQANAFNARFPEEQHANIVVGGLKDSVAEIQNLM